MNNPILEEIYEIRRRMWKEAGGTLEGLVALCERNAAEYRAWDAQLASGSTDGGRCRRSPPPRKRKVTARNAPARGKKMIARKEKEEAAE